MQLASEYAAQATDAGAEWVRVAARAFPGLLTVSKAKRERKRGALLLNGKRLAATSVRLAPGDRIQYRSADAAALLSSSSSSNSSNDDVSRASEKLAQQRHKCFAVCASQGLRVVYESDALAVVVKPAGIHVKGRGVRTVENALPLLLRAASTTSCPNPGAIAPRAVHRLDARVGGVLLVAKTREAETHLAAQFEAHRVVKQYRAILVGRVDPVGCSAAALPSSSSWTESAWRMQSDRVAYISAPIGGKQSCTAMRVVSFSRSARYEWLTTVDLWPLTGRKHQLRLHMALIGHPIAGDDLYHDPQTNRQSCSGEDDMSSASDADDGVERDSAGAPDDAAQHSDVVRGRGLFLYAVGISFADAIGNERSFAIDEPHKFARFRHFCAYNWEARRVRHAERTNERVSE